MCQEDKQVHMACKKFTYFISALIFAGLMFHVTSSYMAVMGNITYIISFNIIFCEIDTPYLENRGLKPFFYNLIYSCR